GFLGVVLGVATLAVIAAADARYDTATARSMGLTTFSFMNLFLALTVRSQTRSVFSLDTFEDHRFLVTSGLSLLAIVLATQLGLLQRLLHTVSLSLGQWLVCALVACSVLVVTEIQKGVRRGREGAA